VGLSLATAEMIRDRMLGIPTALDSAPFALSRASLVPHLREVA
jgi:hypothetical protein